jgi:hypothetical protein
MEIRPMPVTPIHGYREPSGAALKLVNDNKIAEATLLRAIERLVSDGVADARWVEIARTQFEQGYMALNRSILQPDRVDVPD